MKKSFTLQELSELTSTKVEGDPTHLISGVSDLTSASSSDASFLANPRYEGLLSTTQAGVVVIHPSKERSPHKNYLISEDPSTAFQKIIELVQPPLAFSHFSKIHPSAVIHETAQINESVQIGPQVIIDAYTKVGKGTYIGAGCSIGPYVEIGNDCIIHPKVVVREGVIIKNKVIIQPNAVIGSCGFGYTTDKMGRHQKLIHVGNVILEDDVEIGAGTTIDKARFGATVIGEGTKIDNLVQIGHNVKVGKRNFIIAKTGIAGSTTTGNYVVLAGHVSVNGHITIADNVMVAACSGVSKSILKPGKYNGIPAMPLDQYNRMAVQLKNISKLVAEVKELKEKVASLCKESFT